VTTLLFGLAPALRATARPRTSSRLLPALVTVQVALSLIIVMAAGLFGRTLQNLETLDPGFRREGVLLADFYARPSALPATLMEEIRHLPGVISASVSTHSPLDGSAWSEPAAPSGQPLPKNDNAWFIGAGPGFFRTLQTRLTGGREFTARDAGDLPTVAIVNQAYAKRYFRNADPIGHSLTA